MTWEQLQRELDREQQRWVRRLLPHAVHTRLFGDPDQQRQEYENARKHVEDRYGTLQSTVDDRLETLITDLAPAMEEGRSIEAKGRHERIINQLRSDIAASGEVPSGAK